MIPVGLIIALAQSAVQAVQAIQAANVINAKPDPTPEDWAELDKALDAALAASTVKEQAIMAMRAAQTK